MICRSASAAAVAVLALAVSGCAGNPGHTPAQASVRTDGPVTFVADDQLVQVAGVYADAPEVVVFGATEVRNDGPEPVTLRSAELTGETAAAGAEVVEVRVLDTTGGGDLAGAATWPFEHYQRRSRPLPGFSLPPGGKVELLFVVEVRETGTWSWPQTSVTYRHQGQRYRDVTNFGFVICPRDEDECDPTTVPGGRTP